MHGPRRALAGAPLPQSRAAVLKTKPPQQASKGPLVAGIAAVALLTLVPLSLYVLKSSNNSSHSGTLRTTAFKQPAANGGAPIAVSDEAVVDFTLASPQTGAAAAAAPLVAVIDSSGGPSLAASVAEWVHSRRSSVLAAVRKADATVAAALNVIDVPAPSEAAKVLARSRIDVDRIEYTDALAGRYALLGFGGVQGPRLPCRSLADAAASAPEVQDAAAVRKEVSTAISTLYRYSAMPQAWEHGWGGVWRTTNEQEHKVARLEYRNAWNVVEGVIARAHIKPPLLPPAVVNADVYVAQEKAQAAASGGSSGGSGGGSGGGGGGPRNAVDSKTNVYPSEKVLEAAMRGETGGRKQPAPNPCKRFVISLSTIPSRVAKLGFVIRAMKWQDVQPDKVYIGIPPFATRLRSAYDLPPQLLEDPLVEIVHLPVDFGPLSKIMGAIYGEKDPDTCIMTVDDDAEPNSEQLRRYLTWASVLPGLAIGGGGWNSTCIVGSMPLVCPANLQQYLFVQPSLDHMCQPSSIDMYGIKECYTPVSNEPRGVQVLQGVRGILYRRGMFADDFVDLPLYTAKQRLLEMVDKTETELGVKRPAGIWDLGAIHGGHRHGGAVIDGALGHNGKQDAPVNDGHAHVVSKAGNLTSVLQTAYNMLRPGGVLHATPNEGKWRRLKPPSRMFLVDDVYVNAYLAKQGVERIAVPLHDLSRIPYELVPKRHEPFTVYLQPFHNQGEPLMTTVDALHGEGGFNDANYQAAIFFRHVDWW